LLHVVLFAAPFALIGAFIPYFVLNMAMKRRIRTIEKQLVELLGMMANSLRAGFGLMQAVDQATRQMEDPIAAELKQFLRDTQIGSSIEEGGRGPHPPPRRLEVNNLRPRILVARDDGRNLAGHLLTAGATT